MNLSTHRVCCIIPTYNAGPLFSDVLRAFSLQHGIECSLKIVDSGSIDSTVSIASTYTSNIFHIKQTDFNHGATRQLIVDQHPDFDIFVFLTQDAILASPDSLRSLISEFNDPTVGAVCGRQLPHHDADPLATFHRHFNYPEKYRKCNPSDIKIYGIKGAFMSNSFAAYRSSALIAAGGFPSGLVLGEDTYVAALLLLNDFATVYTPYATCFHSHNFSPTAEARRYFDIGVLHSQAGFIMNQFGGPRGEGLKYFTSLFKYLFPQHILYIPQACIQSFLKLIFYKLGLNYSKLPKRILSSLSSQPSFWRSES